MRIMLNDAPNWYLNETVRESTSIHGQIQRTLTGNWITRLLAILGVYVHSKSSIGIWIRRTRAPTRNSFVKCYSDPKKESKR